MGDTTRRLKTDLVELIRDESATSTVEYAIMLAVLVVVVIAAYRHFGTSTSNLAEDSTQRIPRTGEASPSSP